MTFHVRIERDDLAATTAWTSRTLPAKPPTPILRGMVLDAAAGNLITSAFDYDTASSGWCSADVKDEGRVIVAGRLFADTAAKLPGRPVELELVADTLHLRCGAIKATFPTLPVGDYPALPEPPPMLAAMDAAVFADALAGVAHAADDGAAGLPVLEGIEFTGAGEELTLVAVDRYQLARVVLPWSGDDATTLVPGRQLAGLIKHLAGEIEFGWEGGLFSVTSSGRSATLRVLADKFPAVASFFADDKPAVIFVDCGELADAIKRAQTFLADKAPIILTVTDGEMVVSAADEASLTDAIAATLDGPPIEVAVKPGYILNALAALRSPMVRISATTATKAIRLDPATAVGDGPSPTRACIVMPVDRNKAK